jgi:uncharacterized membrane protein
MFCKHRLLPFVSKRDSQEIKMNLRINRWFAATAFTLLIVAVTRTSGQELKAKHHNYKLIDLGTFGGPGSTPTEFQQVLNNRGTVVGGADTSSPNPYPNCFNPFNQSFECSVQHAFEWRGGDLTDLGTLPGGSSSFPYWINEDGAIAGGSELPDIDPNSGAPEFHAVVWRDDRIHDLGTLGGTSSLAVGVNKFGQVTGFALNGIADPFSIVGLVTGWGRLADDDPRSNRTRAIVGDFLSAGETPAAYERS